MYSGGAHCAAGKKCVRNGQEIRFFTEFRGKKADVVRPLELGPEGPSMVAHQFTGGTRIPRFSLESRRDD